MAARDRPERVYHFGLRGLHRQPAGDYNLFGAAANWVGNRRGREMMLARLRDRLRRRQAEQAGADIQAWFRGCMLILHACASVIDDPKVGHGEIGAILDRADRTLFGLSDSTEGIGRILRRHDPEMANRMLETSQKVIELRNLTARFLIHVQGSTPAFLESQREGDVRRRQDLYSRALLDYGLAAMELKRELDGELNRLWDAIQTLEPDAVAGMPDPLETP